MALSCMESIADFNILPVDGSPFYVRRQSLSEMSESFAAPIGTIKRRLHVARKRLARQLETASAV